MQRAPVDSSNIASVGYDPEAKRLHVEFKTSGDVYEYDGIEPHEHEALMKASSMGAHFSRTIRGRAGIKFRKI